VPVASDHRTDPSRNAFAEDGEVWTAGLNDAGQLGHSPTAESVPVRDVHAWNDLS